MDDKWKLSLKRCVTTSLYLLEYILFCSISVNVYALIASLITSCSISRHLSFMYQWNGFIASLGIIIFIWIQFSLFAHSTFIWAWLSAPVDLIYLFLPVILPYNIASSWTIRDHLSIWRKAQFFFFLLLLLQ